MSKGIGNTQIIILKTLNEQSFGRETLHKVYSHIKWLSKNNLTGVIKLEDPGIFTLEETIIRMKQSYVPHQIDLVDIKKSDKHLQVVKSSISRAIESLIRRGYIIKEYKEGTFLNIPTQRYFKKNYIELSITKAGKEVLSVNNKLLSVNKPLKITYQKLTLKPDFEE